MVRQHSAMVALALVVLSACSEEQAHCPGAPTTLHSIVDLGATAFVFVPDENFSVSVEIVAPTETVAGEWIPLRAKRRSGPWKRIRAVLPVDQPWFLSQPPELENEVSKGVFWETDPPRSAHCGFPLGGHTGETQTAMFAKPGLYKIWAVSASPWAKSNVITVSVYSNR
jgi:hypothetical protein